MLGDLTGIHKVRKTLASGVSRYYYYTYRGGLLFWKTDGAPISEPAPRQFMEAYQRKLREKPPADRYAPDTIGRLIQAFDRWLDSPNNPRQPGERTKAQYRASFEAIRNEFGPVKLIAFQSRKMRPNIKKWHTSFARTPRTADVHLGTLVRLLNHALDEGLITSHVASDIDRLHSADRSSIIWEPDEIAALLNACPTEALRLSLRFASLVGLRQADCIHAPITGVKANHIELFTSKSGGRLEVVIPIFPELREVLDALDRLRSKYRHTIPTILFNSRGRPWTGHGLRASFRKAREACGIRKRFHDLRGTAVTRLKLAGLENEDIAEVVGWSKSDVEVIIRKYLSRDALAREKIKRIEENAPGTRL